MSDRKPRGRKSGIGNAGRPKRVPLNTKVDPRLKAYLVHHGVADTLEAWADEKAPGWRDVETK